MQGGAGAQGDSLGSVADSGSDVGVGTVAMFISNLTDRGATPALVKMLAFNEARLSVIAQNIANSNTPGYKAKRLDAGGIGQSEAKQSADLALGRQHFNSNLGQHRERPPRAGKRPAEIVTGDVLHHPAP